MLDFMRDWLMNQGVAAATAGILVRSVSIALVIILSVLADLITRRLIVKGLCYFIARTETRWDDFLIRRKVLTQLSHLAPALVIYLMAPIVLEGYDRLIEFSTRALFVYIIVVAILVADCPGIVKSN